VRKRATMEPALLVMGHGTRSEEGVRQCLQLVRRVEDRLPGVPVGAGFIELAEPDTDLALDGLAARGAGRIVAVPLVLLGAGHLKNDGPAALERARSRHPGLDLSYGRDLGIHPLVLAAAEERARSTLARTGGGAPATVLLVGRGSTDPDSNSDLYKVARLLSESRGLGEVEASFVSLAPPSVPDALDRCARLGAHRIAVVPYFLFAGRLVDRIGEQAARWAAARPETSVAVGDVIGPDERVADLVVERYLEASQGTARMNCDCCIYRTPLPGHEHRLYEPARLHAHGEEHHHGRHPVTGHYAPSAPSAQPGPSASGAPGVAPPPASKPSTAQG
jgi:sirohydrochlorin cobaltochelatase